MPRRNICIPCHCRQHRIMVVSCAAKIENIIPSNDTGE